LLFDASNRPDCASLKELISEIDGVSVSHDPSAPDSDVDASDDWLEVVIDGLTFDLSGLALETSIQLSDFSDTVDKLGLEEDAQFHAVSLVPGPHLTGGDYLLPILRGLFALGLRLGGRLEGLIAYGWQPANRLISTDQFRGDAENWIGGGSFPASILISFKDTPDRGLQSTGLAIFTGQELRLEPDVAEHRDTAHRLGLRLATQLVLRGRIDAVEEVTGPDGSPLRLEPSKNGKFVRVWRT
jgi:hypothetical protein